MRIKDSGIHTYVLKHRSQGAARHKKPSTPLPQAANNVTEGSNEQWGVYLPRGFADFRAATSV